MNGFSRYNPKITISYFLIVIGITMVSDNIFIILSSLVFSSILFFLINKGEHDNTFLSMLFFVVLIIPFNLLFSILSRSEFELKEVFLIALKNSMVLFSALIWFSVSNKINTQEKLKYVFSFSNSLSIIMGMAIGLLPELYKKRKHIKESRIAIGKNKESQFEEIKEEFSILSSWAIERGIGISDYMKAKGFGLTNRSHYSMYEFKIKDIIFSIVNVGLLLFAVILFISHKGHIGNIILFIVFSEPAIIEFVGEVRWNILKSKI